MHVELLIYCNFSDAVQINGIKLLGNASEASMEHLKAMERRAINLWGEATGKTIPLRLKKICMYNVSMSQRLWLTDTVLVSDIFECNNQFISNAPPTKID